MGVPKFFRYISERYPCLSELVKEYQIPEFDNLYLDMNGIIHMCSHPDDNDPHFRILEDKIFQDIFHYIEVLFRMIRPQKLFFMSVDGVAPRAKMNQQRGRRFRSAKDAEKQEAEAKKRGEKLPEMAPFDSNCITPGTVFMAKLQEQLKYFVVDKISHDPTWQKCKVILSGQETPGEGEHKIMDYIRYMRAQPGYDPNTRHCLYGLDADLIMLGLCTHDPHFSLLREEVKFGRKSTKRQSVPEEITFHLLHLSLMREYLELEFAPLKDKLQGFMYDFEKIIDDWVLMGFLVGNDFIPHLPNLHIANGALPVLYKAYMNILPTLDGYINEAGTLNLARFEKFMEKLSSIDFENFEEIRDDITYMEAKTGRKWNAHVKVSTRNLEEWSPETDDAEVALDSLEPVCPRDSGMAALINATNELCMDSSDDTEDQSEDGLFENYKKDYYRNKLEYENVTSEVMRDQAEGYVRAIQWNLNYYYNGCCSWSWYYPHHYSPYISDIKGFSNLKIEFDIGKPFLPYEQLLAVLPSASKILLPSCYHRLMTDNDSLIKEYYPEDFQTDLNGKKQEWEAVVLVPFINEDILLEAMHSCNDKLTPEEAKRNSHGPMHIYKYTPNDMGLYPAPEYFPPVSHNYAEVKTLYYNEIIVPKELLIKGAYPGVRLDVYYPGFPTMKHLKYKGDLRKAKIKVFESPSRNENMIITIIPNEIFTEGSIPTDLLGTSVFVNWPHLVEAKVVAISNSKRKYISMGGPNQYNTEERTGQLISQFKQEIEGITEYYQRRMGIECGETKVLVYVQQMIGQRYVFTPNGRLSLEKEFTPNISNYPLQTVVFNIDAYDSRASLYKDVESVFPQGCTCFTLTNPYYGSQGIVQDSKEHEKNGRVKICISVMEEPDLSPMKSIHANSIRSYKISSHATRQISVTSYLFSRITGSIFLTARNNEGGLKNVNVGLDLKFNKKNKETPGYTKKIGTNWFYTDRAVELVKLYSETYPEVFEYLARDERYDEISAESIFKDDWEEKLKELQNWLKSLPSYSVERQTCGSMALEPEVIGEVEKIVTNSPKMANAKKVTMHIKPNFLYRSDLQNGTLVPDPKTDTTLFDRIVNVRSGFSVPLGLKGTIVSIQEPGTGSDRDIMYDILFDKPFKDGMKLNCSGNRGYRLPSTAFINISYGLRLLEEKTGKPNETIARAEASHRNPYNNSSAKREPNNVYNSVPQQPKQQQDWRAPQSEAHFLPYQSQQPFQKENSAFAQFTNIAGQRQQYQNTQYNVPLQPQAFFNSTSSNKPVKQQNYNNKQKYQALSNNGEVPQLKGSNYFMPTFGSTKQEKTERQLSPQKTPAITRSKSGSSSNTSSNKLDNRPSINTDFLKTMLKNGDERETTKSSTSIPSSSQDNKLSQGETRQKFSFDMFAQAAKAPSTVRLLTYYQSNGLGLPRYQYFNYGKLIQSQITLTSGEQIVGKPAETREEASEYVAADVLEIFLRKVRPKPDEAASQITEDFPIPPKMWVVSDKSSHDGHKNVNVDKNNHEDKADSSQKTKTDTGVLHNSLVPLQAIKKHIKPSNASNKHVKNEDNLKENIRSPHARTEATNEANRSNQKGHSSSTESQHKPKRERKTRIAANFISKKN